MLWLLVSFCLLQSFPTQAPSRDAPSPRTGTATIRGRVTDKETGLPLARIVVQVSSEALMGNPISTITGEDGRYGLTSVPAGRHAVIAQMAQYRTQYLPQAYGQTTPIDPTRGIVSREAYLTIADGESRDGIDIRLTRALGISGRVVNEFGEPMSNVQIRLEGGSGQSYGAGGFPRQTDDRGAFRLFGLMPGRYRVCADPRRFEVEPTRGNGKAPQATCYPGPDAPDGLVLVSADPPDIEIRLQSGRTFTISGVIVDSAGTPADGADATLITEHASSGGTTHPGGRFSFPGLPPGEYSVVGTTGHAYDPTDNRERQLGVVAVRIDAADVEGLTVPLARSARISGRLTSEDGPLPRGTRVRLSAIFEDAYGQHRAGPEPAAIATEEAPFELAELFGPIRFYVSGLPPGWAVKAIRCLDRDVAHKPVELPAGTTQPLEIVVTARGAIVSGKAVDQRGEPAASGTVVILVPNDLTGDWSPLVPLTPTKEGTFKLPAQRAGEYWIAAVEMDELMPFMNSKTSGLTVRFKKVAERITLAEGEQRTVDLRVVKLPEDR